MEIDGFYLFIAGEIGIIIFIIMSRLTDTFERIWDTLFGLVLNTIYIALIPFMIWGFLPSMIHIRSNTANHHGLNGD
mgnify:CR=1 FL=1